MCLEFFTRCHPYILLHFHTWGCTFGVYSAFLQVLKTGHLLFIVITITGVGLLLILAKTIVQIVTEPKLVSDLENPQGTTVKSYSSTMLE